MLQYGRPVYQDDSLVTAGDQRCEKPDRLGCDRHLPAGNGAQDHLQPTRSGRGIVHDRGHDAVCRGKQADNRCEHDCAPVHCAGVRHAADGTPVRAKTGEGGYRRMLPGAAGRGALFCGRNPCRQSPGKRAGHPVRCLLCGRVHDEHGKGCGRDFVLLPGPAGSRAPVYPAVPAGNGLPAAGGSCGDGARRRAGRRGLYPFFGRNPARAACDSQPDYRHGTDPEPVAGRPFYGERITALSVAGCIIVVCSVLGYNIFLAKKKPV